MDHKPAAGGLRRGAQALPAVLLIGAGVLVETIFLLIGAFVAWTHSWGIDSGPSPSVASFWNWTALALLGTLIFLYATLAIAGWRSRIDLLATAQVLVVAVPWAAVVAAHFVDPGAELGLSLTFFLIIPAAMAGTGLWLLRH